MGPAPSCAVVSSQLTAWEIHRPARWRAAAVALALALSGCISLGPPYHRPRIPPPPAWKTPMTSGTPQAWPSADWWNGFHSTELTRLMTAGRAANDDLAAAVARVRQAEAQVRISTAPVLPSLDANGSGSRQRTISPASGGTLLYNQFTAGLSAAYELDFWGRNRALRSA